MAHKKSLTSKYKATCIRVLASSIGEQTTHANERANEPANRGA